MSEKMTPEQAAVVLGTLKTLKDLEAEAREVLGAGKFAVAGRYSFEVNFEGNLGEDYEQAIWQTMKPMLGLGVAIDQMGAKHREAFVRRLIQAQLDPQVAKELEDLGKAIKAEVEAGIKAATASTTQTCKGKFTGNGTAEIGNRLTGAGLRKVA